MIKLYLAHYYGSSMVENAGRPMRSSSADTARQEMAVQRRRRISRD